MAKMSYTSNSITAPAWAGDWFSREHVLPGGARLDVAQFGATDSVVVTLTAGAAQAATSITVAALSGPIPVGTVLRFSADEFATVSTAATAGATSIAVEALVNALELADTATYAGIGYRSVKSGTLVGRTFAERTANTGFGPAASTDDEIYLLAFDVTDVAQNADCELYRHGSLVKENLLPGWATLAGALQAAIRARYQCTVGVQ